MSINQEAYNKKASLISELRRMKNIHVCVSDYIDYNNVKVFLKTSNNPIDDWPLLFNKDFSESDFDYLDELEALTRTLRHN